MPSEEKSMIPAARQKAFTLYEGKQVPHRSCGICLAETFNLPTAPYQALRRGGITGEGECGAIKAGELILGQYLGDPDPTAPVTPKLREAIVYYREQWQKRLALGPGGQRRGDGTLDIICNHLTAPQGEFMGEKRHQFCTNLAATVAEIVAETLVKVEVKLEVTAVRREA
ncbi:MAG: hypothetical protein HZA91_10525 [Verrucomicrobia bacterium]|nr:hypothetical protein [Verrucomicrobiota bacterium]